MTEQDARTKQCWHKYIMCIASDCMAWTWDETEYEYSGGQCPFYEDCDDETCVNIRKVLLNASDNSKGEVKP